MSIPPPRDGAAALVTGASSGIGAAIAGELCARGHETVIVARREDRLRALAGDLEKRHHCRVHPVAADVADQAGRDRLWSEIAQLGLEIDIAAFSAGFGMAGPFIEHDPGRISMMVRTNVESTMLLTHAVLAGMLARRAGAILIVSSMAGHQPMPYFGAYAATKAAVTSFAEMLSSEVADHGVTVTALAPGGVRTEFFTVGAIEQFASGMPEAIKLDAAECARHGIEGLARGERIVMPRVAVRALAFFAGHAPRTVWFAACKRMMSI